MERGTSRRILAAGSLLLALPFIAAESERPPGTKEPWRLSWQERMTLRFSAGEQDRRLEAYLDARRERSARSREEHSSEWPAEWHVVVGRTDPAALTPPELFRTLVANGFAPYPENRDLWRSVYERRIVDPAVREDFWSRLEVAIAPLLELEELQERVRVELNRSPREDHAAILARLPDSRVSCALNADALAAARQAFSADGFDRVLYEAVAPNSTVFGTINQAELESIRRGCR